MDDFQINIEESSKKGRAFIEVDGDLLAEMTYNLTGQSLIIIDHTEVDDKLRGKGIGNKLLDKIVKEARRRDLKIIPLCPFVKSVFKKDKSLSDLWKK